MDYPLFADCLWYIGHVLTGIAIIVSHYEYKYGVVCVFVGQFITIISRPIGRLNNKIVGTDQNTESLTITLNTSSLLYRT
jgi:hypothetical protein